ncbi:MAG TPA: MaoC family dehydratase N-terminal domain-containing protein [Beutenbergiaceae bacterium]|nr:MaoC family dehydratase N-terminal domain-containing protein [Beutenbergiaceae bacterium]
MVNTTFVGREFSGTPPYLVSRAKIAEFTEAVGATSPLHTDPGAAQALGYHDVVAPPTFAVVIAQRAEAEYINHPEAGIDFSRVVHAEESFHLNRPLVAGDEISTLTRVKNIVGRANISMVTTEVELTGAGGENVGRVQSTLAIRGEET